MLIIKLLDFFAIFGFIVFTIMIMAITSVITTKVKRKRKFRRKWLIIRNIFDVLATDCKLDSFKIPKGWKRIPHDDNEKKY